ncbi:MAG: hypothetical protein JSU85_00020 [Candidatus Zixiibacteriota bacterium]|nr:MAG: hypothetical protein JSU85_00020 [candidate division Zixibacteria bacterium]
MKKNMLKSTLLWGIIFLLISALPALAIESDKHAVILDSVEVSAGDKFVVGVSVIADKIAPDEESGKMGFGSFCIPLKYDRELFVVDSVTFMNTLTDWDEKFTNPKIDTGFVSLAGIYDLGGKDNPPVYTPDKPERIAEIFFRADKKAEKGIYEIELTRDPRQNKIYLGSPKGVVSVTPIFKKGIIVVK